MKLAISPIAWSNDDMHELGGDISFRQCISEMEKAGYAGCEVGHKFPRDPKVLKRLLALHRLDVASAWYSLYFTDQHRKNETIAGFINHMNFLKTLQAKVIVVCECGHSIHSSKLPLFNHSPIFSNTDWQMLLQGLQLIGELANANGMKIVYHPHMGTGVENEQAIDRLMLETNPKHLSLLLDTGHLVYAGSDSLRILEKYGKRIKHVHLKDIRKPILNDVKQNQLSFLESVKAGVFTVPGDGCIDFKPIINKLNVLQYDDWLVVEAEQDPSKANPLIYAKKALEYIHSLIGSPS